MRFRQRNIGTYLMPATILLRFRQKNIGTYLLPAIILLASAICSCRGVKYVPVETVRVDSTVIRDTVMEVQLVPYRDSVATRDTASFLSNPYAYSWARWSGGLLQHSLGIWPLATTQVKVPYFIDRYVTITKPQVVEVEKELSKWQQFKLDVGGAALFGLLGLIGFLAVYVIVYVKRH